MKKFIKIFIGLLAAMIMFIVPNALVEASDTEIDLSEVTVEEFLGNNEQAREEYNNLTAKEQEEFAVIIQDPELIKENLELEIEEETAVSEITDISDISLQAAGTTYTTTISGRYSYTLAGIKTTTWAHEIVYTRRSGKVLNVISQNAVVEYVLNPMVKTSRVSSSKYVSGNKAIGKVVFDYRIGPLKGLSIQIGTVSNTLAGNGSGKVAQNSWITNPR
ncbi:hypothetical protein AAK882_07515 [Carnobacteriaceae bacterium 52-44]